MRLLKRVIWQKLLIIYKYLKRNKKLPEVCITAFGQRFSAMLLNTVEIVLKTFDSFFRNGDVIFSGDIDISVPHLVT